MKRPRELAERIVYALECWHDRMHGENEVAEADASAICWAYKAGKRALGCLEASRQAQIEFVAQVLREAE